MLQLRGYSAASNLSKEEIQNRVLDVLKSFEKIKPEKVPRLAFVLLDVAGVELARLWV